MATSQRAKIEIELGRALTDFVVMTAGGDLKTFTAAGKLWSGKSGYQPELRPNGIVSGSRVISPHASDDTVTVAAFTAYSKGALQSVTATSATVSRPATGDFRIVAITMASDGSIAKIDGTSSGTGFVATRDANGGPPLIPVESVELAQIRLSSNVAAVIDEGEIYQDIGLHTEYADYPIPEIHNVGGGMYAASAAQAQSHVIFNEALPAIHTGAVPKRVYIKYYVPTLTVLPKTVDFVPAEVGVTKSSEAMYEGSGVAGAIGAMKADSVGDVSFTVFAENNITDAMLREKNEMVTVKFYPDANAAPHLISQGLLGVARTFPAGEQNKITATVYCEAPSVEFQS